MIVRITSILAAYTDKKTRFELDTNSVREAVDILNDLFPGIKFRFITEQDEIRPHINLFLNKKQIRSLDVAVSGDDELFIVQSLGGG